MMDRKSHEFKRLQEAMKQHNYYRPYKSVCPNCGNDDILWDKEIEEKVHCQRCYHHYEYKE